MVFSKDCSSNMQSFELHFVSAKIPAQREADNVLSFYVCYLDNLLCVTETDLHVVTVLPDGPPVQDGGRAASLCALHQTQQ